MRSLKILIPLLVAAPLSAQTVHTRPAAGVIAGIAPPPPTIVVVPGATSVFGPGNFFGAGGGVAPGNFVFATIPVVVFPDGRVFADFGRGFEQVVRQCGVVASVVVQPQAGVQPTVVQPTVTQPGVGVSPTLPYTPPVPNQQTSSQQMLSRMPGPGGQTVVVNSQACWAANGHGRVYVTRP